MYLALLIIFGYEKEKKLEGSYIDLYRAYSFCSERKAKVKILTDLIKDTTIDFYRRSVKGGDVDANAISFIEKIKNNKDIYNYVYTKQELDAVLDPLMTESNRILLYITGHGLKNGFLLPSGEEYLYRNIREKLFKMSPHSEVFWINDCCHLPDQGFPFKLNNYNYLLNSSNYIKHKIININASSEEDKALMTNLGSTFSQILFKLLNKKHSNLIKINTEIVNHLYRNKSTQIPTITSTSPELMEIFPWIHGHQFKLIDGEIHCYL